MTNAAGLPGKINAYVEDLCRCVPNRSVGSPGNRQATDFVAGILEGLGYPVESPEFACMDWKGEGASIQVAGKSFSIEPSPYSLGGQAKAPLVVISSVRELEKADIQDKVLLLLGEIAKEQLMPKNFPFYNPEEHRHILHLLESGRPQAILSATGRNPELVGAIYPFPLIEDGDFDIPSAFMTDVEGERLRIFAGQAATVDIQARRIPATGCNVIGRLNPAAGQRIVLSAHIDAKAGSPGAVDNAAGVATLLALAELLQDQPLQVGVEIVAFNGEDYYGSPGQIQYLDRNDGELGNILLEINIDDAGYREGKTGFSLYGCPPHLEAAIRETFAAYPGFYEGEQWYQSDHMIFVQKQVPALALTSERIDDVMAHVAHTKDDSPEQVDGNRLAEAAYALRDLIQRLNQQVQAI